MLEQSMDQRPPEHACVSATAGRIRGNHTRRIVCGSIFSLDNFRNVMCLGCYRASRPRRTSSPIMSGAPHCRRMVGRCCREIYLPIGRQRYCVRNQQLPSTSKKRIEYSPSSLGPAARFGPSTNDQCITGSGGRDVQQPTLFSLQIAKLFGLVGFPSGWLASGRNPPGVRYPLGPA